MSWGRSVCRHGVTLELPPSEPALASDRMERDLGRIVAFTDGVMAVAITLLVLNIDVPNVKRDDLGAALVDLLPSLAAYVFSFALVGRFWVVHHSLFERLRAFDATLMALNLLFLAAIALIPFATDLLDEYSQESMRRRFLARCSGSRR